MEGHAQADQLPFASEDRCAKNPSVPASQKTVISSCGKTEKCINNDNDNESARKILGAFPVWYHG